ncbi:MAG: transporter [Sphingobacteriales bacterium 41-5]|nr:MAG: transporter [Sphingobacteriales bacterium 41-5]
MEIVKGLKNGNVKALSRAITLVENELAGYQSILLSLENHRKPVIGITGPPGAGKSTLTDALIGEIVAAGKKVAVICVDPSSPFNKGALLGDRIRMSRWYDNENVFIRSLASRGSMGGLNSKIIEITDVIKESIFDIIIVETVGVGQSEIEIAGLADVTVVVLVPEAGDEIQTMKAGLMEIADVFAVNKSDRPGADLFVRNLRLMLAPAFSKTNDEIKIISTVGQTGAGINDLYDAIQHSVQIKKQTDKKAWLLADKVYQLIQNKMMKGFDRELIKTEIEKELMNNNLNIYKFALAYGK